MKEKGFKVLTIRVTDEHKKMLVEIGRKRYRETNMSKTIRFLIEDVMKEETKDVQLQ